MSLMTGLAPACYKQLADTLCYTDAGDAMHYVNLYDRQLPGDNRNKLEHGLWQTTWYTLLLASLIGGVTATLHAGHSVT